MIEFLMVMKEKWHRFKGIAGLGEWAGIGHRFKGIAGLGGEGKRGKLGIDVKASGLEGKGWGAAWAIIM